MKRLSFFNGALYFDKFPLVPPWATLRTGIRFRSHKARYTQGERGKSTVRGERSPRGVIEYIRATNIIVIVLLLLATPCAAIIVGSDTVVSRAARTTFPTADTNNTILGFAAMESGFKYQSASATCTFDAFFPLSSIINFRGGTLYLSQDCYLDSDATIIRGGRIQGNSHTLEFYPRKSTFELPTNPGTSSGLGDMILLDSDSMSAAVNAVDWSYGNTFVVGVSANAAADVEMCLYVMDGNQLTLTTNGTVELNRTTNDIRWHPTLYYAAIARSYSSTAGQYELLLYKRTISNGTFTEVQGFDYNGDVRAVAWHPSGNYLAAAANDGGQEITIYTFLGGALTLLTSVNIGPNPTFNSGTICWSPDGKYLATGTNARPSRQELLLYYFDGATLTATAAIEISQSIQAVDWSQTGSYIAVGLSGSTERLRVYRHLAYNGTFNERTTAYVGMTATAKSLNWSNDGNVLLMGTSNGTSSVINLYSFDKTTETLSLYDSDNTVAADINGIRYARDKAPYFIVGKSNNIVSLYEFEGISVRVPFYFNNTSLIFNSDVTIKAPCYFEGRCKVTTHEAAISFQEDGAFIVRPGGSLELNRALLTNVCTKNLWCMTHNGQIGLRGASIYFDQDFTFSHGAMTFESVFLSTTNKFVYSTSRTSTISANNILYLDIDFSFSYDPPGPYRNLIYFQDASATGYFNGSHFTFTRTGLDVTNGTLIIDNHCTLSTQARNLAEGVRFSPFINVNFLANAQWDLFGFIKVG